MVELHPNNSHDGGLEVLSRQYDKVKEKMVPSEDILKNANFLLKNNLFEFDCKLYKPISSSAIGTKFALPYASIFMGYIKMEFLKTQGIKPWLWK